MKNAIAFAAGVVAAGVGVRAGAENFCVPTSSELRAALAAVSDGGANQDENNGIYLAAGTYSDVGRQTFLLHEFVGLKRAALVGRFQCRLFANGRRRIGQPFWTAAI